MQPIQPIRTKESPRDVLAAHFKSLRGGIPIRGGWGYTQEDACIIDKDDPLVDPSLPFDGVGIEYVFVEKRIYEELIIFRPPGEKFSGIEWNLQKQHLVSAGERRFDKLVFDITAFKDADWEDLKMEFEGPNGHRNPDFNLPAHEMKRQEKKLRLTREFWFDITSFFGGN